MRTSSSSNLRKAFMPTKKQVGALRVPIVGLNMAVPLRFRAEIDKDIDAIKEEVLLEQAEAAIAGVMSKLAQEVQGALTAALRSSVWAWSDGARDIYDTGELASSVSVTASSNGIRVSYSAPYASLVHDGGYIFPYGNKRARPVYLPPRPWVRSVLYGGGPVPRFDFDGFIQRELG